MSSDGSDSVSGVTYTFIKQALSSKSKPKARQSRLMRARFPSLVLQLLPLPIHPTILEAVQALGL